MAIHANRAEQLADLEQYTRATSPDTALFLVVGRDGMGKSALLRHTRRTFDWTSVVYLDLQEFTEAKNLLQGLANGMRDEGISTARYDRYIGSSLADAPISNEIGSVFAPSGSRFYFDAQVERNSTLDTSAQALMLDVMDAPDKPVTILIDSLDRAAAALQEWLRTWLLGPLCRRPNVRVVVACRREAIPDLSEYHARLGLQPTAKIFSIPLGRFKSEHVLEWLQLLGLTQDLGYAQRLVNQCDGVPAKINIYLVSR